MTTLRQLEEANRACAKSRAETLREFANLLDKWIEEETEGLSYAKWSGRPHRRDMHYWRREAYRRVRKSLRLRAASIVVRSGTP